MVRRQSLEFAETRKPIGELVTKFGGQPVWIEKPEWPLSKSTGKPMRFICQIAIEPQMFDRVDARMAYLFMTEDEAFVDGTWLPDGGENAVILQPGQTNAKTEPISNGPTLFRMVKKLFYKLLVPEPCEFAVTLKSSDDPDFVDEHGRMEWDEESEGAYIEALEGNKIGGSPGFIQSTEFPGPGKWRLLLQLDSTKVPFHVNFGDAGVGYVFISQDGKVANFLWQCC